MNQVKRFSEEFFSNLKCKIRWDGDILRVENVPRSFEDLIGKPAPYNLSFSNCLKSEDVYFVERGSLMLDAMRRFLKGAGKATILKIDFNSDAEIDIEKLLNFKGCEIGDLKKTCKNNFFSRFSFVVTLNYQNKSERVVNEIYVYGGKVVSGDLSGYRVIDGEQLAVDEDVIKRDYDVARDNLTELLQGKINKVGAKLKSGLDLEVERIGKHYDNLLNELGGDLNEKLEKMKKLESEIRLSEEDKVETLKRGLERLKKSLVKTGDDEARSQILKEKDFSIKDVMQKFSLNINRKLVNTTVIYYPVYTFGLFLKDVNFGANRFVNMTYDPLTRALSKLKCEGCGKDVVNLALCSSGHISCGECLDRCGECGKKFCLGCLKRGCGGCGRRLCKDCVLVCQGCGKYACKNHMRKDCVSGEDRCVSCLRACLRCHGMTEEGFFKEAIDGSKVCSKCVGKEKLGERLKIFRD